MSSVIHRYTRANLLIQLAVGSAITLATGANAQVVYNSILRSVQNVTPNGTTDGQYNVRYTTPYEPPPFGSPTSQTIEQYSTLTATGCSFYLSSSGTGSGLTRLTATFDVTEEGTPFWLFVRLGYGGGDISPGGGRGYFRLTGNDINVNLIAQPNTGQRTYQTSGVLIGGTYQLTIEAYGYGGYQQSHYWDGGGYANGFLQIGIPNPPAACGVLPLAGLMAARRRR